MATSYTKTNWQDSPSTATPITAAQLNRMEKGIEDCSGQGNTNELAIAANGAATRTHIHESVSMPAYGLSRKYSKTATPQANKEKTNCRSDSPKNIDSV